MAGNKILVSDVHWIEGLINFPQTLLYCNAFLVPPSLVSMAKEKVRNCATVLANVVLPKDQSIEADCLLQQVVDSILAVGSPLEYILALHAKGQGLPNGVDKYLLWLDNVE